MKKVIINIVITILLLFFLFWGLDHIYNSDTQSVNGNGVIYEQEHIAHALTYVTLTLLPVAGLIIQFYFLMKKING